MAPAVASGGYSAVATIPVGYFPVAVAVDPATGTVDVAEISPDMVSLIDTTT